MTTKAATERAAVLTSLSEGALGELRLREPDALRKLERSLRRHGQLEPLTVFAEQDVLEVLDGFKRLHVARQLRWPELRVRVADVDRLQAKTMLLELHGRRGLSVLEEAWLVRSLYRAHSLTQGAIGARLGRHKTWVCRRLLLAEQLETAVQIDVRLGLLAPRAALALVALPRGNQKAAAEVVERRAMTTRQTESLVRHLLDGDPATMAQRLTDWSQGSHTPTPKNPRKVRSDADWFTHDISILHNVGARLQTRLLATPTGTFAEGVEEVIDRGLSGLVPVLDALAKTARCKLGVTASEDVA